ncbi:MAG: MBL fold metallo-hydrolase [Defluviitaleaceae bacterium]|nr:MBL fold metallo-hydrolase [Defluviitaleaceae bacterium]
MSYYSVKKIYPWLYSIYDPQDVFCYLIVGEKSALLYDTAYGIAPLDEAVRQVCGRPYEVVLSHGHIDHVNGAFQFKEKWISPRDHELCLRHTSKTARRKIVEKLGETHNVADANPLKEPLPLEMVNPDNNPAGFNGDDFITQGAGRLKMLQDGQIFDLGGLTVEVIPMEGHTAGSIGLLVREHKVLLDSDAANYHMWMFLNESLDMDTYIAMLKRVKQLDFDTFFVGHSDTERPKSDFDKYIAIAENIDVAKSKPYSAMTELGGRIYEADGVGIVFNPQRI